MTMLGDLIPDYSSSNSGKKALDLTYRHSVILLSDAVSMGLQAAGIELGSTASAILDAVATIPLLGFVYETPNRVDILKYRYSDYPYLNKSLIVNSYIRDHTRFAVRAHRLITKSNPVPINIAANEGYYHMLKEYCDRGGTFTLTTMWGIFSGCVLEDLVGVAPEKDNGIGGTSFEFRFMKLDFEGGGALKAVGNALKSLSSGIL